MSTPRITLITPSFQQAAYLEECITSIHDQGYPALEHIVVDGGSTDGSAAIIERHAHRLAWWCSEKDQGQSHAINKGFAHATGDIFGWLNSDDALLPGALQRVAEAFTADPELIVFGGRLLHRDAQGDRLFDRLNDERDAARLFADPIINQQSTFYRMDVVRNAGGVDSALRYVMDVELWWRTLFHYGTGHLRFEPVELAVFRFHGDSKTVSEHSGFVDELADLLHGLCTNVGLNALADILAIGHSKRRTLRGIPVEATHRERIRDMAVHFILKWHGHLHTETDFRMLRALHASGLIGSAHLLPEMKDRASTSAARVATGSWNLYRAKRKWQHLFR